ncbi:predicted protein [Histoplasma capsulatum H143]|uniref:Uncharacterized protein n=1 Tax=Ajellomyces capsulatus (strain H143) TaxID=544712 RepID=C6H398_AJECH|nr:predicted protein [Histoplasma capsulatum H143]
MGLGELPLHCVTATQPPGSGPGIVRVHDRLEDGGGRCGRRWDDQPQYPGIKRFILRPAAGGAEGGDKEGPPHSPILGQSPRNVAFGRDATQPEDPRLVPFPDPEIQERKNRDESRHPSGPKPRQDLTP